MTEDTTFEIAYLAGLAVITIAKWLIYTVLLWGMIKVQKLNYNVLGLLGSSLAYTLVAFIPYAGTYLAYAVLVFCLWKCTGAEIAPDVVFTVGIASALMFCVNLFVIGSLMGNLRPDLSAKARGGPNAFASVESTNAEAADDFDGNPDLDEPPSEPAPSTPVATAPAALPAATKPVTSAKTPVPAVPAKKGPLQLKGLTYNATRPAVLISDGSRVHTVGKGDLFTVALPQGRMKYRCEDITKNSVWLKPDDGDRIELRLP